MNKPKILLVIDKPNWAYDQMANFIIKELSYKYDFYKDYQIMKPKNWKEQIYYIKFLFDKYRFRKISPNYNIVIYLWWYSPQLIKNIKAKKKLVGIFTECFPPGNNKEVQGMLPQNFINKYIKPAHGLISGNKNIEDFYGKYDVPVYYATGSTDATFFKYNKKKREDNELRVCWSGNPHRNFKGFFDFVEPAVKLAQEQRPNIKLITRFSGPLETLPEFYSDVDIMVNATIGDAGPGFIIDAGGRGIPTISTNVGFASEIIIEKENVMLVERDIEKIAQKIVEVYDDRKLLEKMSKKISIDIQNDWGHNPRAKYWDDMFIKILKEE